jgi:acyl-CoA reductase-like NAD-dependent aldehyde dehydrogenase
MEEYLEALTAAAARLAWGDPFDAATDIGPVLTREKCEEHQALIAALEKEGVHRIALPFRAGESKAPPASGAYAEPVIVCCNDPAHPLVQEETMSPLLVVQSAESFDEALALCNGVPHGLLAAIFTGDLQLQKRFLAGAEAGMLKINSSTAGADVTLPFSGWKASGIGPPEHGTADSLFYTRIQTIYGADDGLFT